MQTSSPAPALLELDGASLRPLGPDDFASVEPVLVAAPLELGGLPPFEAAYRGFIAQAAQRPWSLPMACLRESQPAGACSMSVTQVRNLAAYLVPLFIDPARSAGLLALYVRHAFWTFPLHRIYVHLPRVAAVEPYADMVRQAGFVDEGVLRAHLVLETELVDVGVHGLLRPDFDAWCRTREPRLSLA